jgi:hypothetical protein
MNEGMIMRNVNVFKADQIRRWLVGIDGGWWLGDFVYRAHVYLMSMEVSLTKYNTVPSCDLDYRIKIKV